MPRIEVYIDPKNRRVGVRAGDTGIAGLQRRKGLRYVIDALRYRRFAAIFTTKFSEEVNKYLVPRLKKITPVRTGRTRDSYRAYRTGRGIASKAVLSKTFYFHLINDGLLLENYITLLERLLPVMLPRALEATKKELQDRNIHIDGVTNV